MSSWRNIFSWDVVPETGKFHIGDHVKVAPFPVSVVIFPLRGMAGTITQARRHSGGWWLYSVAPDEGNETLRDWWFSEEDLAYG